MTDNYRQAEGLSGSVLGTFYDSPLKFKYEKENPKEPTEAMIFGSLCHSMLLEPETVSKTYAIKEKDKDYRKSSNVGKINAAAIEARGLPIVAYDGQYSYTDAKAMIDVASKHPQIKKLLEGKGISEKAFYWEEQGVKCKGKIDRYLTDLNVLIDYKTARANDPKSFYWTVTEMGYLLQLAHYQAAIKHAYKLDAYPGMLIASQENTAPYVCRVYEVPQVLIDEAHEKRRAILSSYAECLATGKWTDVGDEILTLERK